MNTLNKPYKGFNLEIEVNAISHDERCTAYRNGEPVFGTYSSSQNPLSAYEKMTSKIDAFLKSSLSVAQFKQTYLK